ncbi:hypothetical protein LCGC14_1416650 [marine sediment metagenome]|uniref:Uncharacterized protein n=1 Tax=marine sediment metagenome TaxID=412755 RepID=A0A0F9JSN0_9ZZZZ
MTSKERVKKAINHERTDKVPVDLGSSFETGIHAYSYKELKECLNINSGNIEIIDTLQFIAKVEENVIERLHIDIVPLRVRYDPLGIKYGIGVKKWTLPNGITCLVSRDFNPQKLKDGSYMIEKGGNIFRFPNNGFYFDVVKLALADAGSIKDIEKKFIFSGLAKDEKQFYQKEANRLRGSEKAVLADMVIGFEIEYFFGYEKALMNLVLNKRMMIDFIERLTDMYIKKYTQF